MRKQYKLGKIDVFLYVRTSSHALFNAKSESRTAVSSVDRHARTQRQVLTGQTCEETIPTSESHQTQTNRPKLAKCYWWELSYSLLYTHTTIVAFSGYAQDEPRNATVGNGRKNPTKDKTKQEQPYSKEHNQEQPRYQQVVVSPNH